MKNLPYRFLAILLACLSCKSTDNKAVSKAGPQIQEKTLTQIAPAKINPPILQLDIRAQVESAQQAVGVALAESVQRNPVWAGALPKDLNYKEILDPKRSRPGSFSLGSVGRGVLKKGVQLEHEGKHHEIIERHRENKTNYGTKELTDLIRHAAFAVSEEHQGAKLRVGNLSQKGGGDIRWSRSHNSGRDADIAFYVLNAEGKSEKAPTLTKCLGDGTFPRFPGYTFDIKRNWTFVEALIKHEVGIQWIFISNPLKDKLLQYADEKGVDDETIRRAASVLHQPTDALPHDDHFHIRISCPIQDRLDGCLPAGPSWEWLPNSRPYQLSRAIELAEAIRNGSPKERDAAIAFMTTTKQLFRADLAISLLSETKDEATRIKLMKLATRPYSWSDYTLEELRTIVPKMQNLTLLKNAYLILRRSLNKNSFAFSKSRMLSKDVSLPERKLALRALRHIEDGEAIGDIISILEKGPDELKATAHEELQFISNHVGGSESWPKKEAQKAVVLSTWKNLYARYGDSHSTWREAGFVEAGLRKTSEPDLLISLVESGTFFQAYNANRRLREVTGRWSALEFSDQEALHKKWKKWWHRNSPKKDPIVFNNVRDFYLSMIES